MRRVAKEMTSQLKSIIPVLPEKKILNDLSLPSSIVLSNHSSGAGTEEREGGAHDGARLGVLWASRWRGGRAATPPS